jgi:glycosyltransferase involved in cell wall biosynthesis
MHVLQAIDYLIPSGTAGSVLQMSCRLRAAGNVVTVATLCRFENSDPLLLDRLRMGGCEVRSLGFSGRSYDFRSFLRAVWNTRRELSRLRPDVIHTHSFYFEQALNMGFPFGVPAVVELHTDRPDWGSPKPQHRIWDWLSRRFYRRPTTRLTVVSEALWSHARKDLRLDGKAADCIWNGISDEWFEPLPPDPERDTDLVHLARVDSNKNHITTVRALAILARRGRRLKAVLAGDGPELERVRSAVCESGLSDHVQCPGVVYDSRSLYRRSVIAVAPSHYEGFDRAIAEASASGCAILASDIPAHREILDEGRIGRLLPPDDAECWADEIERLLTDSGTRQRLTQAARKWAEENFRFDRCFAKYLGTYAQLAESTRKQRRPGRERGSNHARS